MIESIFQLKWVVSRHQQAPLLKEREQFLAHCQQQGTSHKALYNMGPRADCRHPIPWDGRTPRSQLGRNKAGCRSVGRGTALESQSAELREVGQLLHLRCEEVAALSRKVEDAVSATRTVCE